MENNSNKSDEIDLRVIFHLVKKLLLSVFGYFSNVLRIIKKRWLVISAFTILGAGAGVRLFFILPPTYSSTMTLSSTILNNDYCADMIEELQIIIEDNVPNLLAEKLKIDTISAKKIKRLEFYNYNDNLKEKYKEKDTVILGLPFKIKAIASSNAVFPILQKALVTYLENNEYALKRKEINKQNNLLLRQKINSEIQQLDSLKVVVSANLLPKPTQSGLIFGQPLDPINIYREGISLFRNYLVLNTEAILIDGIQIIAGFSPRNKPDGPILWKSITKGVIAGLFLAFITVLFLETRKKAGN